MTSFGLNTTRNHPADVTQRLRADAMHLMAREARRQARRSTWSIIAGVVVIAVAIGCANKITGGEARQETAAFRASVESPDGHRIIVNDDRDMQATTQPSVTSWGNVLPQIGKAKIGELGSVSMKQVKANWPFALPLGIGSIIFAVIAWKLGKVLWAVGFAGVGLLSFLAPHILVWFVIAAAVYLLLTQTNIIGHLIGGNRMAFEKMPPDDVEKAKAAMAQAHNPQTKKAIRKAQGKI